MEDSLNILMQEIVQAQAKKLFKMGQQIRPNLTEEDILQPNDYPELENSPLFRYEEGVLEGVKTAQMALLAHFQDLKASLN
ncbi:MAG: hypothetical protein S4CHLAM7_06540 [Chlamydiae bacterium]|nr:hypothetical protein [Chlamydiota bacterium]